MLKEILISYNLKKKKLTQKEVDDNFDIKDMPLSIINSFFENYEYLKTIRIAMPHDIKKIQY